MADHRIANADEARFVRLEAAHTAARQLADQGAPKRRTRVYVSGPLTTGMMTTNVTRAARVASILLARGYAAYLPHTNVLWEMVVPAEDPYETWLNHDFEWVRACDALVRLDGSSFGADREVVFALEQHIPVYQSLDTLFACEPPTRPA